MSIDVTSAPYAICLYWRDPSFGMLIQIARFPHQSERGTEVAWSMLDDVQPPVGIPFTARLYAGGEMLGLKYVSRQDVETITDQRVDDLILEGKRVE